MNLLITFSIIVIGFFLHLKKPKWVILFWLSLEPIILPIVALGTMTIQRPEFRELTNVVTYNGGRNLFFVLLFYEFFKKGSLPKMGRIFPVFFALVLFLAVHNILTHFNVSSLWSGISESLSLLLPLIYLTWVPQARTEPRTLFKYICFILVIQVIGVIMNMYENYVYLTYYIPYEYELGTGEFFVREENLVMGSFTSFNRLGNFLTTIYFFVALEYFSKDRMPKFLFYSFSLVVFVIIVLTGARMSLVLFGLSFIISNVLYWKRHKLMLVSMFGLIIVSYTFLLTFDVQYANTFTDNDGINRQLGGLAKFVQGMEEDEEDTSTLSLSTYLIDNYFLNAPLMGNGLSYRGEFAYGNHGTVTLTNFINDSRLAYVLVEFGLIGFMVYAFFFGSIASFLSHRVERRERVKIKVAFLYFIILTIMEPGFFDRSNFPLVYVYALCVLSVTTNVTRFQKSNVVSTYV